MGLSFPLIILIVRFLVSLMMFYLILAASSSGVQPLCHDDERFALLQFKESFILNRSASDDSSAYPKVSSWRPDQISDCCKWDGVECNKDTGHVIGLDLSSSYLKGFLNSNSSLFHLAHLESLNLADNHFKRSPLPASLRQLSRLTNLNLSFSVFSGQIPSEIFELSKLVSLDLSYNHPLLKLQKSGLRVIAQNLTNLKVLYLDRVDISSNVPNILANLSSLTVLSLSECDLNGEFPVGIFHLPNLQLLDLSYNPLLKLHKSGLRVIAQSFTNLEVLYLDQVDISSNVPNSLANLSSLTVLSLSECDLQGEFPVGIFHLPKLQRLDLSDNPLLKLQKSGLRVISQSFTNLEVLYLDQVDISSNVPNSLANLSSLTVLSLSECDLQGEFPVGIFHLPKLQRLDLSDNPLLKLQKSGLRVISQSFTNLEVLYLDQVDISSNVPNSLANLSSLTVLSLSECDLHGEFPVGIFHLPKLQRLNIQDNENLKGCIPEFHRTSPLKVLGLRNTSFHGEIPDSIGQLKSLVKLTAGSCNFSGEIPSSLGNLTNLIDLDLQLNRLHGSIPQSISRLVTLETLHLDNNYFSGRVEFELFLRLGKLVVLQLSGNDISLLTNPSTNSTFPKFRILLLYDCDLREFPEFLRNQDQLELLDLGGNKIRGQVPKWMGNVSIETLWYLNLEHNFLTGFDQLPVVLPYVNLKDMLLDSNMLQGSMPIPPPSIAFYTVSNNRLTGEIPHLICNRSLITKLDLSSNNLSGLLPQCLVNLSASFSLNLHGNNFHGTIPRICGEANKLMMIDFSQNHLQGHVPRSLANCTKLEALNLGNNQIHDIFPSWLGILPELRILILRSNELYGTIGSSDSNFDFPKLHIIDLSNNDFTGKLPSEHFQNWKAMQIVDAESLKYVEEHRTVVTLVGDQMSYTYSFSMTMINKGTETLYERVNDLLIVIDLSNNRFEGEIPDVVGNLKGLNFLILSSNFLTGPIPFTLANLTWLEALDLSQNKLSGAIPLQLTELTFLSYFNVSHNRLEGPIPHGKQFDTFDNSSFSENPELCGSPLSKKCGNPEDSLPPSSSHNSEFSFEFGWKVVAMGYGCGFVFGAVSGQIVITKKYGWFMKTFAIGQPTRRRVNWRGRRN